MRAEQESGVKESRAVSRMLERRDRMVALMLTGNNLATVIAAAAFTTFLHEVNPHNVFWAPFILAPVTLLLGESIPKMLAIRTPLAVARFAARPLNFLAALLGPLLTAETALSRWLRKIAGVSPEAESVFLSREDLAMLVRRGHGEAAPAAPPDADAILPAEHR